jgi:hypothetical protein
MCDLWRTISGSSSSWKHAWVVIEEWRVYLPCPRYHTDLCIAVISILMTCLAVVDTLALYSACNKQDQECLPWTNSLQGQGYSLPADIQYLDSRWPVPVVLPLRDCISRELVLHCHTAKCVIPLLFWTEWLLLWSFSWLFLVLKVSWLMNFMWQRVQDLLSFSSIWLIWSGGNMFCSLDTVFIRNLSTMADRSSSINNLAHTFVTSLQVTPLQHCLPWKEWIHF